MTGKMVMLFLPEEVEKRDHYANVRLPGMLQPNELYPRASWHGRQVEHLGTWPGYAAIRFPEDGRYSYYLVPPEAIK